MAVATMVMPPTAGAVARAAGASRATVLKTPRTKRKPAMEAGGTNLLILGRIPARSRTPMTSIMATPHQTAWGAAAVAEMMDSTGAPPKKEDAMSATEERPVR